MTIWIVAAVAWIAVFVYGLALAKAAGREFEGSPRDGEKQTDPAPGASRQGLGLPSHGEISNKEPAA